MRKDLPGVVSSREELEEDLTGNSYSQTQRPTTPADILPTTPSAAATASGGCTTAPIPPRSLSNQYNQICKTHKKLVKSGAVRCSVSLSDSPTTVYSSANQNPPDSDPPPLVDLPSAPSSPAPVIPQLEGSVHWGAVGDFSGVQTPISTPLRPSVITVGPPLLPATPVSVILPTIPAEPARVVPLVNQPIAPFPRLVESVSALLQGLQLLPDSPESEGGQVTPISLRNSFKPRKHSSTDQHFLSQQESSVVETAEEVFQSSDLQPQHNITMNSRFREESLKIKSMKRLLLREIDDFPNEQLSTARILVLESELDKIRSLRNDYQDIVEDFVEEFEHEFDDPTVLARYRAEPAAVGKLVRDHANMLRAHKETLMPTPGLSDMDRKSLALKEKSINLKELRLQGEQDALATQVREKEEDARVLAETEQNSFLGEVSVLSDIMPDEDWEEIDDEAVGNAMRNLSKWQDQMNRIERSYRKYENMAMKYNFSQVKQDAMKTTYQEKRERFESTRTAIQREDSDRGLFTLEPAKTDIIKYPTFAGLPSEDYLKFREIMELRFRENKVKRREQVAKLRECLRGAALARVPEGEKDIQEAFSRLSEAFGNPSKVMSFHIKALEDLGNYPSERLANGLLSYSKQIEWLLKLEVILGKILDLSSRNSKLAHEAFSSSTYRKLWARFPTRVLDKLVKIQGEDGDRLEAILEKIRDMRQHAQLMDDECSTATGAKKKSDGVQPAKVTADLYFKTPQRYEECRVCVHLSTKKSHQNLFENHLSNYATGCPKFAEATMEMRRSLVEKIKLCSQCFHPDIIFTPGHYKNCDFSLTERKNAFSCTKSSCNTHMWICLVHKKDNEKHMEKFRRDLQRRGQNLGFVTHDNKELFQSDQHAFSLAVRKMRRTEKTASGIVPVPEGEPLFMFHGAKGGHRAINTFYDTGCSHAVFKTGVPGTELKGQIVAKGPFNIGGVGGMMTTAEDEWVVLMQRADGRKQLVQGLTVSRITSDFPMLALDAAERALKDDDSTNEVLQRCRVPPLAGGSVDVLLGIKYSNIFPEAVHSLPNGLTIYRSKLASYQGKYDCCIGGPHSSFQILANIAGGPSQLLSHFVDGLRAYRQWGPPKISSLCLTEEEEILANDFNMEETDMSEMKDFGAIEAVNDTEDKDIFMCCSHCVDAGCKSSPQDVSVSNDERIRDFKKIQQMHDSGLDVEYRCPACRECQDCKAADKTEKVSLREECERFEIQKSVTLDLDNKKFQCSLPLMGKERDFLTCNRERALKILTQQCRKYSKDLETKQLILEAFA